LLQGTSDLVAGKVEGVSLQLSIMREIRRCLAPYQFGAKEISGDTVISDGVTIDSLTLMDMIMELEDRFAICIPMSAVAEIRTVDQLAGAILKLHGGH
jgi:acyl carrier protein